MIEGNFEKSVGGLVGAKIGFYLNDNQFIEGILLDVKQDHLVIHTNLSVFYLAANQIQALSKNAKDFHISSEKVPYLNKSQLTDILDDLKYNWVTINCLSNHTFGGMLSKICEDHIILVNNAEKLYVKKSFISNIYKGVYETTVENAKESVAESSQENPIELVENQTNHPPNAEFSSLSASESHTLSASESSQLSTLDSRSLSDSETSQLPTTDSRSLSESESSQLSTTGSSSLSDSESFQLSTSDSSSLLDSESSGPTLDSLSYSESNASQSSASVSNHLYMDELTQFNHQGKKHNSYRGISKKINRLSAQEYFNKLKKLHENDEPNTENNVLHDHQNTELLNHHELGDDHSSNSNNTITFARRKIRKKRFNLIKTNSNHQKIKNSSQLSSLEHEPLSTNQGNPPHEDYEVFYDDRNYLNNNPSHIFSNSLTIQKHRHIENIEIKNESEITMLKPNDSLSTNTINVVYSKAEKITLEKQYLALMKHAEKMYLQLKNERLKKY